MNPLPGLQPGDRVELIAPASRCTNAHLTQLKILLESWGLECVVSDAIFGPDALCAHDDASRFKALKRALYDPSIKALFCVRGGYGSMRLIPALNDLAPPPTFKWLVGMSDITALQLFLHQTWHWPSLHASIAIDKFTPESIDAIRTFLSGEKETITLQGQPYNRFSMESTPLESAIIGGNLSLIQASIGTSWQLNGQGKILLLEEINERAYRVDRMLEHLWQAGIFNGALALIYGDFLQGQEPDGSSLMEPILQRFAGRLTIPVVKIRGIGHGPVNTPIPFGIKATMQGGDIVNISCSLIDYS